MDDYPGRRKYEKTEDVDFDWNAKPQDIPDTVTGQPAVQQNDAAIERKTAEQIRTVQNYASAGKTDAASGIGKAEEEQKPLSAADRIDKFYTFNRKNEEFLSSCLHSFMSLCSSRGIIRHGRFRFYKLSAVTAKL